MSADRYTCPRCQQPMTQGADDASHSALCSSCGGVWLEQAIARDLRASLAQIRAEQAAEISAAILPRQPPVDPAEDVTLACPVCAGALVKQRFPSLVFEVDRCPVDGTFFDHGELREVLVYLKRTGRMRRAHQANAPEAVASDLPAVLPAVAIVVPPDGGGFGSSVADAAGSAVSYVVDFAGDVAVDFVVELPGLILEGIIEGIFD